MKKILLSILIILSAFICSTVYANPYKKMETIEGMNLVSCTYYAWEQAYNNAHVSLPSWGNAKNWYSKAKSAGYSVGSTPKANSIAVWSNQNDSYGHVAYVVSADQYFIVLNEAGIYDVADYDGDGVFEKTPHGGNGIYNGNSLDADGSRSGSTLIGYIYLDNIPESVPTTTTTKKVITSTTTTTTVKKSNNNYIKILSINDIEFNFDKEVLEYNIDVDNEVDSIKLDITLDDDKSSVDNLDNYELNVGNNKIVLKVIAEDESVREYILNINRKEKIIEKKKTEIKKKKSNKKYYIIGASVLIVLIIIIITIIFKHKKKRK